MEEEWRIVAENTRYEVSSLGRVRNAATGHVLAAKDNGHGYLQVGLYRGGKSRPRAVHRLVALAFIPNPHGKREVNHIDTVRSNARADNLEWVDKFENHDHSARLGKYRAETNPKRARKLSAAVLEQCRARHAAGESLNKLGKEFGVTHWSMSRALKGRPSQSSRVLQKEQA